MHQVSKIRHITNGVDVAPLLWALQAHPELWNQNTARTEDPSSPHHEVSDIWVRYAPLEIAGQPGPHDSVWYDSAAPILPTVKAIVYPLMHLVQGDRLGGVLITKIPARKTCKPHHDDGWHAMYYRKMAVQIQSSPDQRFTVEEDWLEPHPGDIYEFQNQYEHWVANPTEHDRITMIVCVRTDLVLPNRIGDV